MLFFLDYNKVYPFKGYNHMLPSAPGPHVPYEINGGKFELEAFCHDSQHKCIRI